MKHIVIALCFWVSLYAAEQISDNPIVLIAQSSQQINVTMADYINIQREEVRVLLPACDERNKQLFIDLLGTIFYGRDVRHIYDPNQKVAVPHHFMHRQKIKELLDLLQHHHVDTTMQNRRNRVTNDNKKPVNSDQVKLLAYFEGEQQPTLIKPEDTQNMTTIIVQHRMSSANFLELWHTLNRFYNDGARDVPTPIDIENLKTIHDLLEQGHE